MLIPVIPKFRKRRGQTKNSRQAPAPPPGPLTLVAATYDPVTGPTLRLVFNQPIDIAGLIANDVTVDDGTTTGLKYIAAGAAMLETPATLAVILVQVDAAEESDVRLNAAASNGIIAVSDGDPWDGVTNLALPYP